MCFLLFDAAFEPGRVSTQRLISDQELIMLPSIGCINVTLCRMQENVVTPTDEIHVYMLWEL